MAAGYETGLAFVILRDVDLNVVARVAERVSKGGHDIAEHVIRRRWATSIRRFAEAIPLVSGTAIYDNSRPEAPELLVRIAAGVIEQNGLNDAKPLHVLLAHAVGTALGITTKDALHT